MGLELTQKPNLQIMGGLSFQVWEEQGFDVQKDEVETSHRIQKLTQNVSEIQILRTKTIQLLK